MHHISPTTALLASAAAVAFASMLYAIMAGATRYVEIREDRLRAEAARFEARKRRAVAPDHRWF